MSPETWAALEPGVYRLRGTSAVGLTSDMLVMIVADGSSVPSERLLITPWRRDALPMPAVMLAQVMEVRPLVEQGGLSGAMYWGEAIR